MFIGQNIEMPILNQKEINSFWNRVDVKEDKNMCWEWKGVFSKYGKLWLKIDSERKRFTAHRVSYYLSNNIDPLELLVCHKCDNPKCCNPNHLFIGTNRDNVMDMINKGRDWNGKFLNEFQKNTPELIPRGENNGFSKLTNEQVLSIRDTHVNTKISQYNLGKMYGVSRGTIYAIIHRQTWKHI